jgi:hypothetical protein
MESSVREGTFLPAAAARVEAAVKERSFYGPKVVPSVLWNAEQFTSVNHPVRRQAKALTIPCGF